MGRCEPRNIYLGGTF